MKNSLTLLSLANKLFESLRHDKEAPIYTYNDEYMRYFARQSLKGGRCSALNQYYKSITFHEGLNIISTELDNNGKK